ncbi:ATP-binding protein [Paracoccus yeei]|uniref:ATP-binding protein n=1 Tax=Paracoccus yeei TaxID=147645 RepID=UPI002431EE36|nr:ATP-binding protein [Paracoccus yeei]
MIAPLRRLLPDRLAARFSLLLVAAVLGMNLIAAILLAREGSSFDRAIRLQGDTQRLMALVSALESADAATARLLPRRSSTGFTRFSVDAAPVDPGDSHRLPAEEAVLAAHLPAHDIQIREGGAPIGAARGAPLMTVSVRLKAGHYRGDWLNTLAYPLPTTRAWAVKSGLFVPLGASLVGTLLVGLWFIRRMTHPLQSLAQAARAAGRGDRAARAAETGASELREAAVAFNDMQRRIAGLEAERMRMLAALGHDLRTPITSLRLRAELLEDDDQRDDMIRILDDMAVMAEGLLQAATTGATTEPRQVTDLDRLLSRLCAEQGVPYRGPGPVPVRLRPVAISRAVCNLVGNALRYAGNARVTLSMGKAGEAVIRVEDDGPGIPQALLPRVTEPFVRGEESRNAGTGGAGLGLSIARDIARAHGGSLALANAPAGGLVAELHLPCAGAGEPAKDRRQG